MEAKMYDCDECCAEAPLNMVDGRHLCAACDAAWERREMEEAGYGEAAAYAREEADYR